MPISVALIVMSYLSRGEKQCHKHHLKLARNAKHLFILGSVSAQTVEKQRQSQLPPR
jgi:hypothetical protein